VNLFQPMTPQPLLRSPPFPWVSRRSAAISRPLSSTPGPVPDPAVRDALFTAIRAARIGGEFWLAPVKAAPRVILAPRDAAQASAMRAEVPTQPCLVLPPSRRNVDPWSLLAEAELVVADANDELAALALIAGKKVRLHDRGRFGNAAHGACADAVFRHLCADTAYRSPFDGEALAPADVVALLASWREGIDANRPVTAAAGIAWWKRRAVRQFLWAPRPRPLRFVAGVQRHKSRVGAGGAVAAWPSRTDQHEIMAARQAGRRVVLIEDGFVRSNGLGSALHRPWSITLDWRAAHFDGARASDLEVLLATGRFDPQLLLRAAALRQTIVGAGIGKYGVHPRDEPASPTPRTGRRVLAVGQVRGDESLRLGGCGLEEPLDFLKAVRSREPDAEIWYRPHPDVEAGFRDGAIPDEVALRHADRVVRSGSLNTNLREVDAVHVVTSLAGFEALLAGCEVVVHGRPFYAGWSLTRDLHPCSGRTRALLIDELVAGALILYPRYIDPVTMLPCPPEVLIARLRSGTRRHTAVTLVRALERFARRLIGSS